VAKKKFKNINKRVLEGMNIQMARGFDKIAEIKYGSVVEF
jgi:hypothetical protein